MKFETEAFITVAYRSTYEDLVIEARERQQGAERGWWDDKNFICIIENKLKRTAGGQEMTMTYRDIDPEIFKRIATLFDGMDILRREEHDIIRSALAGMLTRHEQERGIYEEMSSLLKESDPDLSRDLHMMIHHFDIAVRFLKGTVERYVDAHDGDYQMSVDEHG